MSSSQRRMTRRTWLQQAAGATGIFAGAAHMASAQQSGDSRSAAHWSTATAPGLVAKRDGDFMVDDPTIVRMIQSGVTSAMERGASYADARFTYQRARTLEPSQPAGDKIFHEYEGITIGIRSLVNGYWGFASSSVYTTDEAARLGREASAQARANSRSLRNVVELTPVPPVRDGRWRKPTTTDPFNVALDEIVDYVGGLQVYGQYALGASVLTNCVIFRTEKAFASSDNSTWTYVDTNTSSTVMIDAKEIVMLRSGETGGWECVRDAPIRAMLPEVLARLRARQRLPVKPASTTQRDVVIDANTMAALVQQTLVRATELDRAMGSEANDTGTSWLNDPLSMLGTQVASSMVTLYADRTRPGSLATVPWDDEGVVPRQFALIDGGVLADYQTTRESATWLAPWYAGKRRPAQSNASAWAANALFAPFHGAINFSLAPAGSAPSLSELEHRLSDGISIEMGTPEVDYQCLSGTIRRARFYDIKGGKRVAELKGAEMEFQAPKLWKSLTELAGPQTSEMVDIRDSKGQPSQMGQGLGIAVPGIFKNVSIRGIT